MVHMHLITYFPHFRNKFNTFFQLSALVLELEGSLTISTGNQEKFTSRMKELSPEVSTKSVCNSKVFTVVGPCRRM